MRRHGGVVVVVIVVVVGGLQGIRCGGKMRPKDIIDGGTVVVLVVVVVVVRVLMMMMMMVGTDGTPQRLVFSPSIRRGNTVDHPGSCDGDGSTLSRCRRGGGKSRSGTRRCPRLLCEIRGPFVVGGVVIVFVVMLMHVIIAANSKGHDSADVG